MWCWLIARLEWAVSGVKLRGTCLCMAKAFWGLDRTSSMNESAWAVSGASLAVEHLLSFFDSNAGLGVNE
jgi:hypothetical protein